ncbi:MAG: hypothetical protein H3C30_00970 [Candidatus Hydrogenedentes bacterium]|nr:hypothetical protein [Candidatus Hydrogenedentota bacterium]
MPSPMSEVISWPLFKRCFTRVDLVRDSGLIARTDAVSESYLNRIRWWNFLEAWGVFLLVLLVVWCAYWLDKGDTARMRAAIAIPTMLWMFILSPLVHYRFERDIFVLPHQQPRGLGLYFWEFRGLGNPWRYYVGKDGEPPLLVKHWRCVAAVLAAMALLYLSAAWTFSAEIDERYGEYYAACGGKTGFIVLLLGGILLGWLFVAIPFMVRLDNFARSVRFIAAFLVSAFVMVLLFNALFQFVLEPLRDSLEGWHHLRLRGTPARERLAALSDPLAIGGQWSGYVTWGWVQQLIFASYFGVLFGRSFPVDRSRWELFKACLCSATVFSLIHLPNVWLMAFTFFGGVFGTLFFYQMFNLFALGFSHGFGGSILNKLTPINFSVGPDQMPRR